MKSIWFIVLLLVIAGEGIRLPTDSESDDCPVRDHSKTPPVDQNAPSFDDSDFGLSTGEEDSAPLHPRSRRGRAACARHGVPPGRAVPAGQQDSLDSRLSAGVPVRDGQGSQVRQDSLQSSAAQPEHVGEAEDELADPQIGIPANVHVAPQQAAALGLPPHHWVYNRLPSGSLTVRLLVGNPPTYVFNRYGSKARSEKVYFRY